jgi:hypothetical protein
MLFINLNFLDKFPKKFQISILKKFHPLGTKLFKVDGKTERRTDTKILKMAPQALALNLKTELKIYKGLRQKLSFLEAELESFRNTYTAFPLTDKDVVKL